MLAYSSLLLIVLTTAACTAGQRVWLFTDAIATIMFGTSLLITPSILLHYQTSVRIDLLSLHVTRLLGLMLLSSSLISHRAFSNTDNRERFAAFISRAVTALIFVLTSIYAALYYPEWNIHFFNISIVGSFCWLLPHLFFSISSFPTTTNESLPVTTFLILDFFLTSTAGLVCFAFPQALLRLQTNLKPNSISVSAARFLGALFIGNSLVSLLATALFSLRTKKYLHGVNIITAAILLTLIIIAHSWGQHFFPAHLLIGVVFAGTWGLNSVLGYMVVAYIQAGYMQKYSAMRNTSRAPDCIVIDTACQVLEDIPRKNSNVARRVTFAASTKLDTTCAAHSPYS